MAGGIKRSIWKSWIRASGVLLAVLSFVGETAFTQDRVLSSTGPLPEEPREKLAKMTTEALVQHILDSKVGMVIGFHDTVERGLRAFRDSRAVKEFLTRGDAGEVVLSVYRKMDPFAVPEQSSQQGAYSFRFMCLETLLCQPEILEQLAGKEKDLIRVVVDKIERREAYNKGRIVEKEEPVYSMASAMFSLILLTKLQERLGTVEIRKWLENPRNRKMLSDVSYTETDFWQVVEMAKEVR